MKTSLEILGIEDQFVQKHKEQSFEFKYKFSDFIVIEKDMDNVVCTFEPINPGQQDDRNQNKPESAVDPQKKDQFQGYKFESVQDQEMIDEFSNSTEKELILDGNQSKDGRTLIHKQIRSWQTNVNSETRDDGLNKKIVLNRKLDELKRKRCARPEKYQTHFTVRKFNFDCKDAAQIISKTLSLSINDVAFAGTKDKRAITFQRCSVKNKDEQTIVKHYRKFNTEKIKIGGPFFQSDQNLEIGQLKGNLFRIVLRNVSFESINEYYEFKNKFITNRLFINQFGHQRFTKTGETQKMGAFLLKGDQESAVRLIMTPNSNNKERANEAKEFFKKVENLSDLETCLKMLPHMCLNEKSVLIGMIRSNSANNQQQGINNIPRTSRMMYSHAVQSYIFNRLVSQRLSLGMKLISGDCVQIFKNNANQLKFSVTSTENENQDLIEVTDENLSEVTQYFSIENLIIPLTGQKTVINPNLKEKNISIMNELGITFAMLKDARLKGDQRQVFKEIKVNSIKLILSKNPEAIYIDEETGLIKNITNQNEDFFIVPDQQQVELESKDQSYNVYLEFELDSSTYATIAIREIMNQNQVLEGKQY